ncbi:MAG: indole-3-glycerol phosphate synthase TrpC [Deferrisomatales bacterium]|nr:indole-3-glycerol phosphate synthase TrpC [Deferrisomatales bacterium]
MTVLDEIARTRRRRVEESRAREPLEALRERALARAPARDPVAALAALPPARRPVIAEIKRRSPSKGPLRPELDPSSLARQYEEAGALAVSVLTEPDHFGGSVADLEAVRAAVSLPLLYKDFVLDPYQVWEARAAGADLVLLIAALLGDETPRYVELAREAGLAPLVEVHDAADLGLAAGCGARLIGVNNRDLRTFRVDLQVSRDLLPRCPPGTLAVAESGLGRPEDLDELARFGARAFLIGEALVREPDPGAALRRFVRKSPER